MNNCREMFVNDLTIALGVLELVGEQSELADDLRPLVQVALSRVGKASERLGEILTTPWPGSLEGPDQLAHADWAS